MADKEFPGVLRTILGVLLHGVHGSFYSVDLTANLAVCDDTSFIVRRMIGQIPRMVAIIAVAPDILPLRR